MLTVTAIMDTSPDSHSALDVIEGIPDSRVALHQKEFRRAVKTAGLNRLAEEAGKSANTGRGSERYATRSRTPQASPAPSSLVPGPDSQDPALSRAG